MVALIVSEMSEKLHPAARESVGGLAIASDAWMKTTGRPKIGAVPPAPTPG